MSFIRHANRSFRKSIEVCNRASEFPGWLRSLLASLDACPCLVSSVHQKERCALNCDQATSLPYMWPIGHVNFPSSQHLAKIQSEVPHIKKRLKRPMVATTHSDLESDQINLDQQDNKKQ